MRPCVGLSRRQVYRMISAGRFPQPVELSGNSIGFHCSEVDDWLASRRRVSYSPEPESVPSVDP